MILPILGTIAKGAIKGIVTRKRRKKGEGAQVSSSIVKVSQNKGNKKSGSLSRSSTPMFGGSSKVSETAVLPLPIPPVNPIIMCLILLIIQSLLKEIYCSICKYIIPVTCNHVSCLIYLNKFSMTDRAKKIVNLFLSNYITQRSSYKECWYLD